MKDRVSDQPPLEGLGVLPRTSPRRKCKAVDGLNSCVCKSQKDPGKSCQCVGDEVGGGERRTGGLRNKKGGDRPARRPGEEESARPGRGPRGRRPPASSGRLRTPRKPTFASSAQSPIFKRKEKRELQFTKGARSAFRRGGPGPAAFLALRHLPGPPRPLRVLQAAPRSARAPHPPPARGPFLSHRPASPRPSSPQSPRPGRPKAPAANFPLQGASARDAAASPRRPPHGKKFAGEGDVKIPPRSLTVHARDNSSFEHLLFAMFSFQKQNHLNEYARHQKAKQKPTLRIYVLLFGRSGRGGLCGAIATRARPSSHFPGLFLEPKAVAS